MRKTNFFKAINQIFHMELVKKLVLISIFFLIIPFVSAKSDESSCSVISRGPKATSFWAYCMASDDNQPTVPGETGCLGGACVESCSDQWHLYFECYCIPLNPYCVHDDNIDCPIECMDYLYPRTIESTCEEMLMNSSFYDPGNLVEMGYCECCKATDGPYGSSPRDYGEIRGNNPFVKGETFCRSGGPCMDWCLNETLLDECYCEGYDSDCKHTEINCMSLLGPNGKCIDGACVLVEEECFADDPPFPPIYPQGNDPFVPGHTECQGGPCDDHCEDYRILDECFCPAPTGFCDHAFIDCYSRYDKVCIGGACRDPTCIATDPPDIPNYPQGNDPLIAGSTICIGGPCIDSCRDGITLDECYCSSPTGFCDHQSINCDSICGTRTGVCRTNEFGEGYCHCYTNLGGGGCPTLFVHDGKGYVKERKSKIHFEVDVIDGILLETKPVAEGGAYSLLLKETTLPEHSHLDSVRLLVDGEEVELIAAVHSRYGDVTSILKESDDIRTDTKVFDEIELKFLAPEIEGEFLFEIEGYNRMWAGPPLHMIKLDVYQLIPIVIIAVLVIIVVIFAVMKFLPKK